MNWGQPPSSSRRMLLNPRSLRGHTAAHPRGLASATTWRKQERICDRFILVLLLCRGKDEFAIETQVGDCRGHCTIAVVFDVNLRIRLPLLEKNMDTTDMSFNALTDTEVTCENLE